MIAVFRLYRGEDYSIVTPCYKKSYIFVSDSFFVANWTNSTNYSTTWNFSYYALWHEQRTYLVGKKACFHLAS